jgi:DNA-binding NarL/FixJ family response regulator
MSDPIRVLFVDDDPNVLAGLVRSLRTEPTLVISSARSFDGALAVLESAPIDVLVTDHGMPGQSGADLLAHVARSHPKVHRIMLSGSRSDMHGLNAHTLLAKPVSREALLAAIYSTQDRDGSK